jgi:hypothetical protein
LVANYTSNHRANGASYLFSNIDADVLGEIKGAALRTQIVAKATSCLIDCCLSFLASNQVFGGK